MTEQFYELKIFLVSPTTLWIVLSYIEGILRDEKFQKIQNLFSSTQGSYQRNCWLETRVKR